MKWDAFAQSDKIPGMSLGAFKVNNNGAATYSIPIIVPPGTNGLAPKLSLAYDSQSRNGPLGIGWSLVGIPAIHRCAKTVVQDNFKGGVFYDANDRFCLDGQRLMSITPNGYDSPGTEYRTELDTFVRVFASTESFASSDTGTMPRSFIVKNKAGETLEFGNTNDSRIEAAGRLSIRVWALNRITDSSGNYMTFTYQEDNANGDYRLSRIDYTGNVNQGVASQRYVQFLYEPRPNTADTVMVYVGGSIVQTMMRLIKIQTYAPDPSLPASGQPVLVREYRIEYAPEISENRPSLITSVTECTANSGCVLPQCLSDGSCLPANKFNWQTTQRSIERPFWNGNDFQSAVGTGKFNFIGDFNGDGKTDIASKSSASTCTVHLSNGAGFSRSTWTCGLNTDGFNYVGDFNGDGKADILVKTGTNCKLLISTGSNFNPITGLACNLSDRFIRWNLVGDFNGDGRTDITARTDNGCALNLSTGAAFSPPIFSGACFINEHNIFNLNYVGDFNGDGKADILARIGSASGDSAGCFMNLGTEIGFASSQWECSLDSEGKNYLGDFNGDGKTDILNVNGDGIGPNAVSLATGTRFDRQTWWAQLNIDGFNWVGDFDGDGRSDILSKDHADCFIHYSRGNSFYMPSGNTLPGTFYQNCSIDNDRLPFHYTGDFTGDGRTDLLHVLNFTDARLLVPSGNFPDLVTSIDTSLGGKIDITYLPINSDSARHLDADPIYTKDNDAQYPIIDVKAPYYVVDSHTADNGTRESFTFTYAYGGAKYHHLGRGWLGFRWMHVIDQTANVGPTNSWRLMIRNEYIQVTTPDSPNFPLIGMLKSSNTSGARALIGLFPGSVTYQTVTFSEVNNTYAIRDTQPGLTLWSGEPRIRFPELVRTDKFQCDGLTTCLQTASEFTYDINGNSTLTRHLGDVTISGDERDEVTEWIVDNATWLHRPKRTALLDNLGITVREKWLYYDNQPHGSIGTRGLLTKEESRLAGSAGNAGNPTNIHSYDGFGNRTSSTNPIGCTTTTTVETLTNTFPATVTNCLNPPHTTSFTWDPRHGVKLTEVDPNNQPTTFTFDAFGRPRTVVGPKDSPQFPTVSYDYLSWGDPANQRIQVQKRKDHLAPAVVSKVDYFDGLGRFDLIESTGPNHPVTGQPRTIIEEVLYDSRNLIVTKTPARFNDEPMLPVWDYVHDVLGRQTRVDHPDNRFAETIYEPGMVTLIDERGIQKVKFLDAYGRVKTIHEKNGAETYVTTYEYDATGALTHVQNHLGHHTRIKYDSLGRKIAMCDPNMGAGPNTTTCDTTTPGAWKYTYDKAGNLLTQTDAKNQTLTFTYDALSRVKTKVYPNASGTITYTYDDPAVPFSKGRLTKVQDLSSMVTTFLYDNLGRVTQTQRTIDGITYTMSQTYNALGSVVTETFPDLDGVTYTYNEAGWLKAVNGYVNRIDYNARGQRERIDYVNGVSTNLDYFDNSGTPDFINFAIKSRLTAGPSGTLQNFSYGYDEVNNVETITDALFTASRIFTYDDLNRLTSGSGAFGGSNQSQTSCGYSYNAIGNILTKCGSTYFYNDPNHPSFVTATSDGRTYTADANGNTQSGAGRTFSWTADNRVASVTNGSGTTNMNYDYTGARVKKWGPLGLTVYPFAGYEVGPTGTKIKFFKAGNELLAGRQIKTTGASTKLFYHNDHLGGINVITDDVVSHNGARQQLIEYDPWGKISRSEGTTNLESERRFTGQILDAEFGLYYYGARYYDPELARFISPDPIVPSPGDPQTLNRYSYVRNNPVKYIDPTGHDFWSDLGNFFKNFFKSLPALITGIFVAWLVPPAWGPVVAGVLAGMAAGAVNTAINGGNFGYNIGMGALFGGIAGAIGPPIFKDMGGVATNGFDWSNFLPAVKAGAVVGAALGGLSTAIRGGNFLQNVAFGALGGGITSAGIFAAANAWESSSSPVYSADSKSGSVGSSRNFPIVNEPSVKEALNTALDLQASTKPTLEQSVWFLRNRITGSVSAEIATDSPTHTTVGFKPLGFWKSLFYEVVGQGHTHPIYQASELGPQYGIGKDVARFQGCDACGSVHIVVDNYSVYGFDKTSPSVSFIGSTRNILGRIPEY